MSRIGKQPIEIPQGVTVTFEEKSRTLTVSGPHGELRRVVHPEIGVSVEEGSVTLDPVDDSIFARSLWGTFASHLRNMIEGVTGMFEKKLVLEGVGYRVEVTGGALVLNVGFSHPVRIDIPEGLDVSVDKSVITVRGVDKELVGGFSARVKGVKKPEPYKGKGIRYEGETIRRKQGKKAA